MGKRTEAQDRSGVGQLADDYLEARKRTVKDDQTGKPCLPVPGTKPDCSQHDKEEGKTSHRREKRPFRSGQRRGRLPVNNCGKQGLVATRCPEKAMYCTSGRWPISTLQRAGLVEGR